MTADNAVTLKDQTGVFVEASATPNQFKITAIQSGKSKNNNFYPAATLKEAVPLFEGARVFMKPDALHLQGGGKDVSRLIGGLRNAAFVEGATPDNGSITATLVVIEPSIATKLTEAVNSGMTNLFGFSIDAEGDIQKRADGVREAKKFKRVHSVDMIVEAGAGGKLDGLMREAFGGTPAANEPPKYAPPAPSYTPPPTAAQFSYTPPPAAAQSTQPPQPQGVSKEQMFEAMSAMDMVANCKLPAQAKQRIREAVVHNPTIAHAAQLIENEGKYLESVGAFKEAQRIDPFTGFVMAGQDQSQKSQTMLDDLLNGKFHSLKEAYRQITGDVDVTGEYTSKVASRLRETAPEKFREAVNSSTFALMFGDSLNKKMINDYKSMTQYQIWRPLVTVVPLGDLKTQHRVRMGGYGGTLPIVAERANYTALTSPTEEEATYAPAKRGVTESISWEAMRNDDVGAIRRLPMKMADVAARTLGMHVLDILRTNPTIYDTKALFHVDHANLGSAALSANGLAAARLAMMAQTELGSGVRLGIPPRNLWIPADLEQTAYDLFNRTTNLDKTFIQSQALNITTVWYWTDANDWVVTADVNSIPFIELGFLDGREEPEMFVQDMPNTGSMFNNDTITYKLRHVYGSTVLDYRGAYKSQVA